jgi:hypothetical protein
MRDMLAGIGIIKKVQSDAHTREILDQAAKTTSKRPWSHVKGKGGTPASPLGIHMNIGRRPIAAFGNSDGDLQMLQWTTDGTGSRLALVVQHTDSVRKYAYEAPLIGKLDFALKEAKAKGWDLPKS